MTSSARQGPTVELSSYYSALILPSSVSQNNNASDNQRTIHSMRNSSRSFHSCTFKPLRLHTPASTSNHSSIGYSFSDNNSNNSNNFHNKTPFSGLSGGGRRGFASGADDDNGSNSNTTTDPSVDSTLERLFRENEVINSGDGTAEPWVDGAQSVASSGLDFVPTWYNPADQCIQLVFQVQEAMGVELSIAIITTTLVVRTLMLPIVISGQKSASRMAHVNPELMMLRNRYEKIADPTTEDKAKLGQQVRDLFNRYEVKPVRSMITPFIQFPFFMGMFFGLKKMPDYFPEEMANGGMLWFPDLTMTDPYYILPAVCFFTFLATVEMGKEQMYASNPTNAPMMINVFRGLSLMMIPICVNFHMGMLCYWTVSNIFTLGQIGFMKIPAVKKAAGIWDPPKPVPGLTAVKDEGIMAAADKMVKQMQGKPTTDAQKLKLHNEQIENKKKVQELSKSSRERRRRSIKRRET